MTARRAAERTTRRGGVVSVHVTPNAKVSRVTAVGENALEVRVDEKAEGGRANRRLVELLSAHFGVPKSRIAIVRGLTSRDKVVVIAEE